MESNVLSAAHTHSQHWFFLIFSIHNYPAIRKKVYAFQMCQCAASLRSYMPVYICMRVCMWRKNEVNFFRIAGIAIPFHRIHPSHVHTNTKFCQIFFQFHSFVFYIENLEQFFPSTYTQPQRSIYISMPEQLAEYVNISVLALFSNERDFFPHNVRFLSGTRTFIEYRTREKKYTSEFFPPFLSMYSSRNEERVLCPWKRSVVECGERNRKTF